MKADNLPSDLPIFQIRASSPWRMLDLRELWAYRELIYFLAWRDIKVRYKQTGIGIAWALLQPLAMIVVFTVFFGRLAGLAPKGVPYPLFVLAGLIPWQLFSRAITESTNSLVTDQRLITRVYFPRIIVPISTILGALVDFLICCVLLGILLFAYGQSIPAQSLLIPAFVLLLLLAAMGVGFWLSALNVEYRDVMYAVPFLNQLWFFMTPIVYPVAVVPEALRPYYALNPMVGVVQGFRWALFGAGELSAATILTSLASAAFMFVTGCIWFRRRERTFVDAIGSGGR
jgi:homopolymeric O-antigen transport system permease protein